MQGLNRSELVLSLGRKDSTAETDRSVRAANITSERRRVPKRTRPVRRSEASEKFGGEVTTLAQPQVTVGWEVV